jgi:hypothetical protein
MANPKKPLTAKVAKNGRQDREGNQMAVSCLVIRGGLAILRDLRRSLATFVLP